MTMFGWLVRGEREIVVIKVAQFTMVMVLVALLMIHALTGWGP